MMDRPQERSPTDRGRPMDLIIDHLRAERTHALLVLMPVGLILLGATAAILRTDGTAFGRAAGLPILLYAGVILVATRWILVDIPRRITLLDTSDPDTLPAEAARIVGQAAGFRRSIAGFCAVLIFGLGLYLLGNWLRGLGAALMFVATLSLLIDGFAMRRIETFADAISELELGLLDDQGAR